MKISTLMTAFFIGATAVSATGCTNECNAHWQAKLTNCQKSVTDTANHWAAKLHACNKNVQDVTNHWSTKLRTCQNQLVLVENHWRSKCNKPPATVRVTVTRPAPPPRTTTRTTTRTVTATVRGQGATVTVTNCKPTGSDEDPEKPFTTITTTGDVPGTTTVPGPETNTVIVTEVVPGDGKVTITTTVTGDEPGTTTVPGDETDTVRITRTPTGKVTEPTDPAEEENSYKGRFRM